MFLLLIAALLVPKTEHDVYILIQKALVEFN
jgi:hypothetical protein